MTLLDALNTFMPNKKFVNKGCDSLTMILQIGSFLYFLYNYVILSIYLFLIHSTHYNRLPFLQFLRLYLSWGDRFLVFRELWKNLIINSCYLIGQLKKLHFNQIPFLVDYFFIFNELPLTQHRLAHNLREHIMLPRNSIHQLFMIYILA